MIQALENDNVPYMYRFVSSYTNKDVSQLSKADIKILYKALKNKISGEYTSFLDYLPELISDDKTRNDTYHDTSNQIRGYRHKLKPFLKTVVRSSITFFEFDITINPIESLKIHHSPLESAIQQAIFDVTYDNEKYAVIEQIFNVLHDMGITISYNTFYKTICNMRRLGMISGGYGKYMLPNIMLFSRCNGKIQGDMYNTVYNNNTKNRKNNILDTIPNDIILDNTTNKFIHKLELHTDIPLQKISIPLSKNRYLKVRSTGIIDLTCSTLPFPATIQSIEEIKLLISKHLMIFPDDLQVLQYDYNIDSKPVPHLKKFHHTWHDKYGAYHQAYNKRLSSQKWITRFERIEVPTQYTTLNNILHNTDSRKKFRNKLERMLCN